MGKWQVCVIQCCHLVEAIGRAEEGRRGGNYGQRLLRMRHSAITYNDVWSKHRSVAIKISRLQPLRYFLGSDEHKHPVPSIPEQRVIYQSPSPTAVRHVIWAIRRLFL